jgi:hypothetical protein
LTNEQLALFPLSTPEFREIYVTNFKLLDGYEDLTKVSEISLSSGNVIPPDPLDDKQHVGAIVGGVLAGVLVLAWACLIGYVYYQRNEKDKYEDENMEDKDAENSTSAAVPQAAEMGSSEKLFEDYGVVGGDRLNSSLTPDEQSVVTFDYDYARVIGGGGFGGLSPMSAQGSQSTLTVDLDQAYEDVVGGMEVDGDSASLTRDDKSVASDDHDEYTENIGDISVALSGNSGNSDDGIKAPYVGGNESTTSSAEEDQSFSSVHDEQAYESLPGNTDEEIEVPYVSDNESTTSSAKENQSVSSEHDKQVFEDMPGNLNDEVEVSYVGDNRSTTSFEEEDESDSSLNDDQVLEGNEERPGELCALSRKPDEIVDTPGVVVAVVSGGGVSSGEFDHLPNEATETPDDELNNFSANNVEQSVSLDEDDQEYDVYVEELPNALYAPPGEGFDRLLNEATETPDDELNHFLANNVEQSVSSDDDDEEYDDYIEKFPNALYAPLGELDVILEDSIRSLADHGQEYCLDKEQTKNFELPSSQETHSSNSSKHSSNSSKNSSREGKNKSEAIFDTAQRAILQAQEILQTLSLESSSGSSTGRNE